jgi:hypothetical protein
MSIKKNIQLTYQLLREYLKHSSNRKERKHGFFYPSFSRILVRKKRFRVFFKEMRDFFFILSKTISSLKNYFALQLDFCNKPNSQNLTSFDIQNEMDPVFDFRYWHLRKCTK